MRSRPASGSRSARMAGPCPAGLLARGGVPAAEGGRTSPDGAPLPAFPPGGRASSPSTTISTVAASTSSRAATGFGGSVSPDGDEAVAAAAAAGFGGSVVTDGEAVAACCGGSGRTWKRLALSAPTPCAGSVLTNAGIPGTHAPAGVGRAAGGAWLGPVPPVEAAAAAGPPPPSTLISCTSSFCCRWWMPTWMGACMRAAELRALQFKGHRAQRMGLGACSARTCAAHACRA